MAPSTERDIDINFSSRILWALPFVGLLGAYLFLGYLFVPTLMIPLGCSPGDEPVGYGPMTAVNVSYLEGSDVLEVTHAGGDPLRAGDNNRLEIHLLAADGQGEQVYSWTDAGGEYPIRHGDAIAIHHPTVGDRSLTAGDVVRVIWDGSWEDPEPEYCPYEGPDGLSTLAEQRIEDESDG